MTYLKKNEKWILGIGLIVASVVIVGILVWMQTHLTVDFKRIDEVIESKYWTAYIEFKEFR